MSKPIYSMIHEPFGLEVVTLDDPAAGDNFSWVTPDDYLYRLLACHLLYTSDASAANRELVLLGAIGSSDVHQTAASQIQTASTAYLYHFEIGANAVAHSATSFEVSTSISSALLLPPGATIKSLIANIQATDQLTNIVMFFQWFPIPR